jgi:hypothetical protein
MLERCSKSVRSSSLAEALSRLSCIASMSLVCFESGLDVYGLSSQWKKDAKIQTDNVAKEQLSSEIVSLSL